VERLATSQKVSGAWSYCSIQIKLIQLRGWLGIVTGNPWPENGVNLNTLRWFSNEFQIRLWPLPSTSFLSVFSNHLLVRRSAGRHADRGIK
jgi:hypothetical protein